MTVFPECRETLLLYFVVGERWGGDGMRTGVGGRRKEDKHGITGDKICFTSGNHKGWALKSRLNCKPQVVSGDLVAFTRDTVFWDVSNYTQRVFNNQIIQKK